MAKAKVTNEFAGLDDDTTQGNDLSEFNPEVDGEMNSNSGQVMDIDTLNNLEFDDERDRKIVALMTPPRGDWVKTETWEMSVYVAEGDCEDGDVNSEGRTLISFKGKPDPRQDKDGNVHQPNMNFRISPDVRFKEDDYGNIDTTKPDSATKLYAEAKEKLYFELKEERPRKFVDVLNMLRYDTYTLNTMNGDNGLVVLHLKKSRNSNRR